MVLRLRRCFMYGIALAFLGMLVTAVVFMRNDISKNLNEKAELVVKSNKRRAVAQPVAQSVAQPVAQPVQPVEPRLDEPVKPVQVHTVPDPVVVPLHMDAEKKEKQEAVEDEKKPDYNVHIFYYPWYGNPEFDNGTYLHWNHEILPNWNKQQPGNWPTGQHVPPDDIGANFYPQLGCYSSRDLAVVAKHMQWIRATGAGVVAVSWYPAGLADDQGHSWDNLIPVLLDAAHKEALKIVFHIEPYKNRNIENLKHHIEYIMDKYGKHPAFYYFGHLGKTKPLFYIYDSYLIPDADWTAMLTTANRTTSVRGTKSDAFYVGLVVEEKDKTRLLKNGFDGMYTYFAADGFTYASTWINWASVRTFAKKNRMLFIPAVGPGYLDVAVRPWNRVNMRPRRNGSYYEDAFQHAIVTHPDIVSITSFNEWHEGTQIEPAVPKQALHLKYEDYSPMAPDFYLQLTRRLVTEFTDSQNANEIEKSQNVAAAAVQ